MARHKKTRKPKIDGKSLFCKEQTPGADRDSLKRVRICDGEKAGRGKEFKEGCDGADLGWNVTRGGFRGGRRRSCPRQEREQRTEQERSRSLTDRRHKRGSRASRPKNPKSRIKVRSKKMSKKWRRKL